MVIGQRFALSSYVHRLAPMDRRAVKQRSITSGAIDGDAIHAKECPLRMQQPHVAVRDERTDQQHRADAEGEMRRPLKLNEIDEHGQAGGGQKDAGYDIAAAN